MKKYEIMFIINSTVDEEAKTAVVDMAKQVIEQDGEVLDVKLMGNKKLAYPIEKRNDGYYVLITFKAGKELPKELDRRFRITENIMRHLITVQEEK